MKTFFVTLVSLTVLFFTHTSFASQWPAAKECQDAVTSELRAMQWGTYDGPTVEMEKSWLSVKFSLSRFDRVTFGTNDKNDGYKIFVGVVSVVGTLEAKHISLDNNCKYQSVGVIIPGHTDVITANPEVCASNPKVAQIGPVAVGLCMKYFKPE